MPKKVTRMAVGELPRAEPRKKPTKKRAVKPKVSSGGLLPSVKMARPTDPLHMIGLVIGDPKVGKTTFLSSIPDVLFAFTEPGQGALSVYEINPGDGGVRSWEIFRKAVDELEKTKSFSCVAIDTISGLYDLCQDWVCDQLNIQYPGVNEKGGNDYGKSWRFIAKEFLHQILRIHRSGRGIWMSVHSGEKTIPLLGGGETSKIIPRMTKQCATVVEPLCDFMLQAAVVRDRSGEQRRILITQAGDRMVCGHRKIEAGRKLPTFLPLEEEGGFEIIERACNGEDVGISAEEILPATGDDKAVGKIITQERVRERKENRDGE